MTHQDNRPSWIEALPCLGAGIGFRRPLARDIAARAEEIDFLEIIAEHYFDPTPYDERELRELALRFPLIPHCLGLSVASVEPAPRDYLLNINRLVNRIRPAWWSDHLAMTRAGRIDIGHLAPLPFTREMLDTVCFNIERARSEIHSPFIIENIAYTLRLPGAEMSEAEFLSEVVERTDAGLLLDLMNLYANSLNHGYDAYEFLSTIPLSRVVQVHIIGGHYHDGVLIDSHSQRAPEDVWRMLEFVARRVEIKAALVEWDERFPDFAVILNEVTRAREIVHKSRTFQGEAGYVGA